jgi:hypothetical protein
MNPVRRNLTTGSITLLVGLPLWLFAGGIKTPIVTLTKLGIVLMVVGGCEILYALYLKIRGGEFSR